MLLRLIDDYLFITTDHAKARRFLDVMVEGQEPYAFCSLCLIIPRTPWIWLSHLSREISDKFRMCPPHCNGDRTGTEMCVSKGLEYLAYIWHKIAFPWCALFINMNDLSVSTDYTRYHDTCRSSPHIVKRAVNWIVKQSSWILSPLTVGAVLALPSYTRCYSMFHNAQLFRGLHL